MEMMIESVEIRCDLESLDSSESDTIWGAVWLEYGKACFPERGWMDMVVAVLIAIAQATRALKEGALSAHAPFFDGPMELDFMKSEKDGLLVINMKGPEAANPNIIATSWTAWVSTVIDCAGRLIHECERRSLSDQSDVVRLKHAVDALA
jgi:hypothetical protein